MPTVRKLSLDELQAIRDQERQEHLSTVVFGPPLAAPTPTPEARLEFQVMPGIGDVIRFRQDSGEDKGIVLRFHGSEPAWSAVELLVAGQRRWLSDGRVIAVLGRPPGISRINHPARRTYGWYVRVYEQGVPRLARLFSDGQYQGISAALEAALAFHAAESAKHSSDDAVLAE